MTPCRTSTARVERQILQRSEGTEAAARWRGHRRRDGRAAAVVRARTRSTAPTRATTRSAAATPSSAAARAIDIAKALGTDILVLWLAREGTYIREAKNGRRSVDHLVEAFDQMLAHDKKVRLAIEPKPNEPMDHAYIPTIGHALAIAQLTRDPKRVGCLIESRPRHPRRARSGRRNRFRLRLRQALVAPPQRSERPEVRPGPPVRLHEPAQRVRPGPRPRTQRLRQKGEFVCFDVHPFRTTREEHWMDHLVNSRRTFLRLVEKARSFDEKAAAKLAANRALPGPRPNGHRASPGTLTKGGSAHGFAPKPAAPLPPWHHPNIGV